MKEFLNKFNEEYYCKEYDNGFTLYTPIMYKYADHTFSFYIEPTKSGSFKINDRGQTIDYLRENLDYLKYMDKINKVCEFFEIDINGTQFESVLPSYESGQTFRRLETFINAMSIIANIELF